MRKEGVELTLDVELKAEKEGGSSRISAIVLAIEMRAKPTRLTKTFLQEGKREVSSREGDSKERKGRKAMEAQLTWRQQR